MEGALPSVVGGLVGVPATAVPTSIGYGAAFNGLAALLGMINSCASNVTVENIDNGFGAGYVTSLINRYMSASYVRVSDMVHPDGYPVSPSILCANLNSQSKTIGNLSTNGMGLGEIPGSARSSKRQAIFISAKL